MIPTDTSHILHDGVDIFDVIALLYIAFSSRKKLVFKKKFKKIKKGSK